MTTPANAEQRLEATLRGSLNPASPGQIFRVVFKVRPTLLHPDYYGWEFGFLNIWLFDKSGEIASIRAQNIVDQLPYEIVQRVFATIDTKQPKPPEMKFGELLTVESGVGIRLFAAPIGADEGDFESGIYD
jgi:hypothetical protein